MNEVPLPLWAEMLIAALVLGGATIALLGSLGLLRLKSYFERVHAPSIIATRGCWLIMWATFVFFTATGQGLVEHEVGRDHAMIRGVTGRTVGLVVHPFGEALQPREIGLGVGRRCRAARPDRRAVGPRGGPGHGRGIAV